MQFKINEEFAKHYNNYRQKEEMQKLKSRYGDVKLKKRKPVKDGDAEDSTDDSSSSSSSSESDSEWEEEEHKDFLRLYDALCRDDPALNDETKVWFREKPEGREKEDKEKGRPVLLKDHARDLLLAQEQEDAHAEISAPADWNQGAEAQKEAFLAETEKLFGDEEGDLLCRKTPKSRSKKPQKSLFDTSHFTFPVSGENEEFLRDYLVNRRWKAAEKKPPTQQKTSIQSDADAMVDEILTARTKPSTFIGVEPLLIAPEELEEDDNFLVKARRFEDAWNKNDEELAKQYPTTIATRYRFEEEDKEFIKTYPRKITDSLRRPSSKGMTRAEKRKARVERKAAEKAAKMADIERLKRLKMAEFAEKLERIRRTCGDGIAMEAKINMSMGEAHDPPMNEVTEEMIDCLDNDWDPEAHDRLVAKLFGDDYYCASTADDALDEAPKGESDEEDNFFMQNLDTGDYDDYLPRKHRTGDHDDIEGPPKKEKKKSEIAEEQDNETSALVRAAKEIYSTLVPRKRGKRAHGRSLLRNALDREKPTYDPRQHPDFEKYFNEFYQLDCEDIINGAGPGDDVHCRFKYRSVKPNDFGLSLEEILKADEKELNRWVSVKTMSVYRTEEEEERDIRKYHSSKMLRRKAQLIPSLLKTESEEDKHTEKGKVESAEDNEKHLSKKALKRLRKKQRKAELFSVLEAAEADAKRNHMTLVVNEASEGQSKDIAEVEPQAKEAAKRAKEPRSTEKRKLNASEMENKEVMVEEKSGQKTGEHHHHYKNSSKKPKLSDERLRAAGIDPKQFRYMKSNLKR